jgi:hypothetical protein
MIRGKKNFLPPVQLVYGFGYLFKLDESSIGNHVSEKRKELAEGDDDNDDIESDVNAANDTSAVDDTDDKLQKVATEKSDEDVVQDEKNSPAESGKKRKKNRTLMS